MTGGRAPGRAGGDGTRRVGASLIFLKPRRRRGADRGHTPGPPRWGSRPAAPRGWAAPGGAGDPAGRVPVLLAVGVARAGAVVPGRLADRRAGPAMALLRGGQPGRVRLLGRQDLRPGVPEDDPGCPGRAGAA